MAISAQRRLRARSRGFTLIELLVVVTIIVSLAAISVAVYASQKEKAEDAGAQAQVKRAAMLMTTGLIDGSYTDDGQRLSSSSGSISKNGVVAYVNTASGAFCISKQVDANTFYVATDKAAEPIPMGQGCSSAVFSLPGAPGAPTGLTLTAGSSAGSIKGSWSAPASIDGGIPQQYELVSSRVARQNLFVNPSIETNLNT